MFHVSRFTVHTQRAVQSALADLLVLHRAAMLSGVLATAVWFVAIAFKF